jgi:hypothetical protein
VNRSVKRIIALAALWLCAAFAIAQAPIGVCLNNVAQTISNGVIAPIPYATVALCTPGSTAANCVANKVNIFTSTSLSTATPTNPFTSDAGGNYFFCAPVGHYAQLINSSYGQYFVPDVTLDDNWAAGGTMTGTLTDAAGFIGPLTGNAATASALAATPSDCNPLTNYAYGISANGNALCNPLPAAATLYYQTVQNSGSALTQQPVLNFDGTVVGTNGTGKTNVGLPAVGTAGTYSNPSSITVDAQGRAASITASTAVDYYFSFTGCTLPPSSGTRTYCTATLNFTTSATPTYPALSDAIYIPVCWGNETDASSETDGSSFMFTVGGTLTTTGFTYYEVAPIGPANSHTPTLYCHVHHD